MNRNIFIYTPDKSGSFNMACDEYFLNMCENGIFDSICRIYTWDKPSISIGYFFKSARLDTDFSDYPLVRRLTGGNALLHDNDISYSIIINLKKKGIKGLRDFFIFCADLVIKSLKEAGVKSCYKTEAGIYKNNPDCFDSVSQYEIISSSDNRKITGSAQKLLKNSGLHHGSIRLNKKNNIIVESLKKHMILDMNLIKYEPDQSDYEKINNLFKEKYSLKEWNYRK